MRQPWRIPVHVANGDAINRLAQATQLLKLLDFPKMAILVESFVFVITTQVKGGLTNESNNDCSVRYSSGCHERVFRRVLLGQDHFRL